jgi:hypothetical protein
VYAGIRGRSNSENDIMGAVVRDSFVMWRNFLGQNEVELRQSVRVEFLSSPPSAIACHRPKHFALQLNFFQRLLRRSFSTLVHTTLIPACSPPSTVCK